MTEALPSIRKAAAYLKEIHTQKQIDLDYLSGFSKQSIALALQDAYEVLEKAVRCRQLRKELTVVPEELKPRNPDTRWEDVLSTLHVLNALQQEKAAGVLQQYLCQPDRNTERLEACVSIISSDLCVLESETLLQGLSSVTFAQAESKLRKLSECIHTVLNLVAEAIPLTISLTDNATLFNTMKKLADYQKNRAYFTANDNSLRSLFGPMYQGEMTHFDTLCQAAEAAEQFRSLGLPEAFFTVTCRDEAVRIRLASCSNDIRLLYSSAASHLKWLDAQFDPRSLFSTMLLSEQTERVQQCLMQLDKMHDWLDYCEIRRECIQSSLADYIRVIEKQEAFDDVADSFLKGFYSKMIDLAFEKDPLLGGFRLSEQEERISRFRQLDTTQMNIARLRILSQLIDGLPDSSQLLRVNDETSVLRKQLSTKRQMPLRKLFSRIPNLLLRLSPCMMMSPLSVSYFLEAETYQFDMVIFDEASQIRPEDAVGAILRGQQVVIAGDVKQMPPTNFFKASAADETEDSDEPEEELGDSILEEAACSLPGKTLLWHYRSRHEGLITFSNHAIYRSQLITFPSSRDAEDMGVQLVYVADGLYEKNQNLPEAEKCVALLERHIQQHPERSLGIIAFSEKQQDAILMAVEHFRLEHPRYEWFFENHPDEPFFVKNLENVQGDERDTIIFSICYGKDRNHRMYLRFGPLGQQGGERRLNVAITRAKCNVKLVSSILPEDLRNAKAQGVKLLRDYIYFAQHGSSEHSHVDPHPGEHDDFCDMVAEYLVQHGYQVHRDVGNSSYRIDIGVLYPGKDDEYLAGIECDGDSYRRAQTARDRDVLRNAILKNMGWNMHRIWSTEWVRNGQTERMRLLQFLYDCLRQDRSGYISEPVSEEDVESMIEMTTPQEPVQSEYAVYEETPADLLQEITSLTDYPEIADDLRIITEFEQPVHIETVYRRMQTPMKAVKMAAKYKNAIQITLKQLLSGQIRTDSEGFLWTIPAGKITPRRAANKETLRKAEHIALEEIMELMKEILQRAVGLTADDVIAETASALGYEHRGTRINNRLQEALDRLFLTNMVKMIEEKIVWNGGDAS